MEARYQLRHSPVKRVLLYLAGLAIAKSVDRAVAHHGPMLWTRNRQPGRSAKMPDSISVQ